MMMNVVCFWMCSLGTVHIANHLQCGVPVSVLIPSSLFVVLLQ